MKWRHSVIYLLVLMLLGGYYYYFEVVKKQRRVAAEKQAKQMFQVSADVVRTLEISPKDKKRVVLRKDGQWEVVEPIKTEADKYLPDLLVKTLVNLESEREISSAPEDLKSYGLLDPSLKIRFQSGDQWNDLLVGDKSPTGGGYYAKTDKKASVVLISDSSHGMLNKGLDDLRRHELFTFQPQDVNGVQVSWGDGKIIQAQKENGEWKITDKLDLKVNKRKVENIIDQLHWLRAQSFVGEDVKNLDPYGLQPAYAGVKLQLRDGGTAELLLGKKDEKQKQIVALSSQLPAIVRVDAGVLDDLPRDFSVLENRSLFSGATAAVNEVSWDVGGSRGRVVSMGDNRWGVKEGEKEPAAIKDPSSVDSFLSDLSESEFKEKVLPEPPSPEQPYATVELRGAGKQMAKLVWQKPSPENSGPVNVWLEEADQKSTVLVEPAVLRRLETELGEVLGHEGGSVPSK